eukprot:TRINITY_DN17606_c0_g1_i1.p1 TRINITY_DN17606_c0_g1~~TRINITY_DN17606_c0_g1_i1.p1  ORF type:complete len:397 (+),score=53.86 TRINITY_DN17606_c0_g1_i1:41-1231(+)
MKVSGLTVGAYIPAILGARSLVRSSSRVTTSSLFSARYLATRTSPLPRRSLYLEAAGYGQSKQVGYTWSEEDRFFRRPTIDQLLDVSQNVECNGLVTITPSSTSQTNVDFNCNAGEDAFFVSSDAVGVADGVGGWSEVGIDTKDLAWSLMNLSRNARSREDGVHRTPKEMLRHAIDKIRADKLAFGSATACVVTLDPTEASAGPSREIVAAPLQPTATLLGANLGDSGLLVMRDGEKIFRTQEQQHRFNMPFQLTASPPDYDIRNPDEPEMAIDIRLQVMKGDILILGTDGLFDNLFDGEICASIEHTLDSIPDDVDSLWMGSVEADEKRRADVLLLLAKRLAHEARKAGQSRRRSPFYEEALKCHYYQHSVPPHGKWDDVTVVVGVVADCEVVDP